MQATATILDTFQEHFGETETYKIFNLIKLLLKRNYLVNSNCENILLVNYLEIDE